MDYVGNYKLDARPDRIDLRDREYTPPLNRLAKEYPSKEEVERFFPLYSEQKMVLDQGAEGACTGFGLAAMVNYLLWRGDIESSLKDNPSDKLSEFQPPAKVSMRMLYHLARFYDEWPGEDYEGSSCRGAVKAWHRHGVCANNLWPYRDNNKKVKFIEPSPEWDMDAARRPLGVYYRIQKDAISDMQAAIQEVGAIYASAHVHSGWNLPQSQDKVCHENLPVIDWQEESERTGGHAFALVGYNNLGFIVQNSWGNKWGIKGFGLIGYDDWVKNGTDAWVCVMGVPKKIRVPAHYISPELQPGMKRAGDSPAQLFDLSKGKSADHEYQDEAVKRWNTSEAYNHTVVMGNDGKVINRLVTKNNAENTIDYLVYDSPKTFFQNAGNASPPRLAIYAHGGLNSEESSIERIRTLAPYFKANGIYPLFFTWKTGVMESLLAIMEDSTNRLFDRSEGFGDILRDIRHKAEEVMDRTLEIASSNLGVKALWSQMKQNATEAAKKGSGDRGAFLSTLALKKLVSDFPNLEIHLVGHSAGSLILGNMLGDFPRNNLSVKSFSLFAPACSLDFANRHIQRAIDSEVLDAVNLHIHMLSERLEQDDTVGPYHKSLLYLVSRALEDHHKTPLLGLANAFDPEKNDKGIWSPHTKSHLTKWQKLGYWGSRNLNLLDSEYVVTARKWHGNGSTDIDRVDAAHGSFDNDVDVVTTTISRILGGVSLKHKVENLRY